MLTIKDIRSESTCASAGRSLTLTKDGHVAVPILNPTDRELTLLPAFTELVDTKQTLSECLKDDCQACNLRYRQNFSQVKSLCSSASTLNGSAPSGRSNFPAKNELEKVELLPNLDELKDRLTPVQLARLQAVLEANAAVSAKNKADVGRCRLVEHRIDLEPNPIPHHEGARHMAPWKAEKANKEVKHLLSLDLIELSFSPWACGIVTAQKKGNQLRFCCDFKFLKAKTIRDAYSLPRIDESLARLGCAIYFTILDLGSGFWQVPLRIR